MSDDFPNIPSRKRTGQLPGLLLTPIGKRKNLLVLGMIGFLIVGFIIYGMIIFGPAGSQLKYSPADVVYGNKIRAVHFMGESNLSQLSGENFIDSSSKPEISLSEDYYDFGEVSADQVVTRTFVIANSGQSTLVILGAYTTCGCTSADFTANEIPPGKVALMTLQFDTSFHAMSGTTVRRGVVMYTNDPEHLIQEIWIQASVR